MNDAEKKGSIPYEIERKYLIRRPEEAVLQRLPEGEATEIIQTYLTESPDGFCRRVRSRESLKSGCIYTFTRKKTVDFGKCVELEEEISRAQYCRLLQEKAPDCRPIVKTRWCFVHEGQLFELDVYDFSKAYATLEIELEHIHTPVQLPDYIEVIADVTGNSAYSNAALSRTLCFPEP
jgi:CYTH domain-containing protein